jgi:hypothetical protein
MHTPSRSFGHVARVELPLEGQRGELPGGRPKGGRWARPGALIGALGALLALAACSSDSGGCQKDTDCATGRICGSNGQCEDASGGGSGAAPFVGSWLCNFTLTQPAGVMIYPPSPVETVVTGGASLSINDEESDSEPQSWFCGFNYGISGTGAALVGTPTCESSDLVALESATVSLSADGNQLTLQESGTEYDHGTTEQSTIAGTCARN